VDARSERLLALFDARLDRAVGLAGLVLGDRDEAEDAVQEAAVRAWRSAGDLRDPATMEAWFDRIVVNVCRDRLRRRRRVRFIPLEGAEPGQAGDPFAAAVDRDEVLRALDALDADQRVVVVLHYWGDLTLVAVAERTGWPLGTVKSRLHHALERMRRRLESADER
jgi:RNA polymerase sigma-70 factor (ECF subfamily)